jgi:HAD superfamily phosphoserine phosphatase-like hydrolase
MKLVFFDIDRTLIRGATSEQRFFWYLLGRRRIRARQIVSYLAALVVWLPEFGNHILKKNKAYLTGLPCSDIDRLAKSWIAAGLDDAWYKPCVDRLREHLSAGDRVVLLSGTPDFLASAIATRLGVGYAIGTTLKNKGGHFVFAPPGQHPFDTAKLLIAREFARAHGFDARDVVAYGDSEHDSTLLLWAGTPVAVRPEQGLARIAQARGWELLNA